MEMSAGSVPSEGCEGQSAPYLSPGFSGVAISGDHRLAPAPPSSSHGILLVPLPTLPFLLGHSHIGEEPTFLQCDLLLAQLTASAKSLFPNTSYLLRC